MKQVHVKDIPVKLDAATLLKRQGYEPDSARWAEMARLAAQVALEAKPLIRPQLIYAFVPVSGSTPNHVQLAGAQRFVGVDIAQHLLGSESVVVAAMTIGGELESKVSAVFEKDTVRSLLLDTAGNVALSQVVMWLCSQVDEYAASCGLETTAPIAPGQLGWRLEEQRVVISILDASSIGVRLTDSCLMVPLKSETLVIGMGNPSELGRIPPCERCQLHTRCRYRRW